MKKVLLILSMVSLLMTTGCGLAVKRAPHMWFGKLDIETKLEREDVVIMGPVEGTSTMSNFLGIIQIVDGDKLQILGIPFFKDKLTYWEPKNKVLNRAYYKALAATPDADAIFSKSYDIEEEGIPFILGTKSITVKGKAIKLKSD
jgi:hypothetical protein